MNTSNYNIKLLPDFSALDKSIKKVDASLTGMSATLDTLQQKLQTTFASDATTVGVQAMESSINGFKLSLFELTGGLTGYASVVAENFETVRILQEGFATITSSVGTFSATLKAIAPNTAQFIMNLQFMAGTVLSMANTRITALTRALTLQNLAAKASALSTAALSLVMSANPVTLVVTAIATLVAAFIVAYGKCDRFRGIVDKAWSAISQFGSLLRDNIIGAFESVCGWMDKAWDKLSKFLGLKDKARKSDQGIADTTGLAPAQPLPESASWISNSFGQMTGLKNATSDYSLVVANVAKQVDDLSKKQAVVSQKTVAVPDLLNQAAIAEEVVKTPDLVDRAAVAAENGNLARGGVPMWAPSLKPSVHIPVKFDEEILEESTSNLKGNLDKVKKFATITGEQIASSMGNSVVSLAKGIGEAMITGDWSEQLRGMLLGLMDMLQQFASALIATGFAALAFKGIFANPIVGIIAGTALMVATSVAKAALQSATAFAAGGIVSGPTLALVGEYSGASNNPEVIAPLNKLRSMIEPSNSSLNGLYLETKVRGKDLYVALRSVEHEKNRTR